MTGGKKLNIIVGFVFVAVLAALNQPARAEAPKVAVLPFAVHSKANAPFLGDSLLDGLVRELKRTRGVEVVGAEAVKAVTGGKTNTKKEALEAAKALGATHVVWGTITEFGDIINVDATVLEVSTVRTYPPVSVQGRGLASIGTIVASLKSDILMKVSRTQRIARIEIKGNKRIETGVVNQALKSSQGSPYSESKLAEDIKAIHRLGYFDDVAADVQESPEGKVITFLLKEKGVVTEILIKGNKALDTGDIEGALDFKVKQPLNREKIATSMEKIKALYDNKGYYNAEITPKIEKVGEKDSRVVIEIKEHEKLYIRRIAFEGNQTFSDKELKDIMTTSEKGFFYFFTDSGVLKKDQLKQDVNRINAFYLNNGFINAQVGEPRITTDKKGIYITITIKEGQRFKVGKVDIKGDRLEVSREKLLEGLKIGKKEFFNREAIIKDIEFLTQACQDEGYAYAEIAPKTTVNEAARTVDVTYEINKGHLVYFNRIVITGNTKTRDKVMRRMLSFAEGDLYNSTKLKDSYKALEGLRYFEEIDFQSQKGPDPFLTDVSIRVKEKPTGMFSIGAGYSALEHATLMAQITQQNLFGRAQVLSLKATIGSIASYYELAFIEPWLFDIPLWTKLDLWNSFRVYDNYEVDTDGFGITFSYPIWKSIYGQLGYTLSNANVTNIQETASSYIKEQEGRTTTSSTSLSVYRDTTDDNFFPTKGSLNGVSWTHAGGILGGNNSFDKYGAFTSWYFSLPLETVFNVRGRIGYLQANEGKELPIYERYYVGGINSLRGLRNVGPKDPKTGDVIGGTTMMYYNFEFLFPLVKNAGMKGVVFYDTGNAWEGGYHFDDMRQTAGVGIRWYSPVGPLRLEWGHVLDRKEGEDPSRWEFTIGMFM